MPTLSRIPIPFDYDDHHYTPLIERYHNAGKNKNTHLSGWFLFCLNQYSFKFPQEQNKFWLRDKLLPVFKHGFLRSEEMFI